LVIPIDVVEALWVLEPELSFFFEEEVYYYLMLDWMLLADIIEGCYYC